MCFPQPGSADGTSAGRAWCVCDRSVSGAGTRRGELSPLVGRPGAGEGSTKTTACLSQGTDTRLPCSQGVGGTGTSLARAARPAAQPRGFAVARGRAQPSLLSQQRAGAAAPGQWWRRSASVRLRARAEPGRAVSGLHLPSLGHHPRPWLAPCRRGSSNPKIWGHGGSRQCGAPGAARLGGPQRRGAVPAAPGCAAPRARCWEPSNLKTRAQGLKLCDMLFVCK